MYVRGGGEDLQHVVMYMEIATYKVEGAKSLSKFVIHKEKVVLKRFLMTSVLRMILS